MNERRDNNQKGNNKNGGKKRDPRSFYSHPPLGMNPNEKRKENKQMAEQNHLLAKLKSKYGENFPNIADVMNDLSNIDIQLDILIRQMFTGRFNFAEYGKYLFHPVIYEKLINRVCEKLVEATIHVNCFDTVTALNQAQIFNWNIPANDLFDVYNRDTARKIAYEIIRDSLVQMIQIRDSLARSYMMQGMYPNYDEIHGQITAPVQAACIRISNERTKNNLRLRDYL